LLDVVFELHFQNVDISLYPESLVEIFRSLLNGPRSVTKLLLTPHAVHYYPQIPVSESVSQEQKPAVGQLGLQLHRHQFRHVRVSQVVDVIILSDDETVFNDFQGLGIEVAAICDPVDGPMNLQDHSSFQLQVFEWQ